MSCPYYDVQVNYNSRSGLIEIYMFRGGWRKVMAMNGAEIRINSDRTEIKRFIKDLVRKMRVIERSLDNVGLGAWNP